MGDDYAALRETAEYKRLADSRERAADWKNWGPYVSDRAWGTVREDYSATGEAWDYFPHDHARSRAYRWNEDGIAGVCNRFQNACLSVAFWNEQDPILKERFFGLTGNEGNHGEDVKEYYFYLDSTPTHSYMKMLYKYPQVAYPYSQLVETNRSRGKVGEYELIDAIRGAWDQNLYFDIFIEYAKADENDILCRITAHNRSAEDAPLHILPHMWFRNTWSWGYGRQKPEVKAVGDNSAFFDHRHIGAFWYYVANDSELLFTDNETNHARLYNMENATPYVKDAFHRYVIDGEIGAVNPDKVGTKLAAHVNTTVPAGHSTEVMVRFTPHEMSDPFENFDAVFEERIAEADAFYGAVSPTRLSPDEANVERQAFAGLMWTKQFYHYGVQLWQDGDPGQPMPPSSRRYGRNQHWRHLYALDVISMPDKWEYPWFAAWDLAFHMLPVALVDPEWAKRQLVLMLREWYMHPNGQIPAYEWAFGDVNPPVHAWACWRVYKIARNVTGNADIAFLERVFHKLLLNFTWWVNRKDAEGNNVFEGGFLGLDNIGIFDRSQPLPTGGNLEQADGTAWMGMFCLNMLSMALELAIHNPAYEDVATKFFEHFIYISNAIRGSNGGLGLWDDQDGFFYDRIRLPGGGSLLLRSRSFVGLIPLYAVMTIEQETLDKLPRFTRRMEWFIQNRPWMVENMSSLQERGLKDRLLLSLVNKQQLERILGKMLDEGEFLSEYGLRSLSKIHQEQPYTFNWNGATYSLDYQPAESNTNLFGGNSNWRGPIWFPVNFLMVESLQKFWHYYGDDLTVEMPAGSGNKMDLWKVAGQVSRRLNKIFLRFDERRAFYGDNPLFQQDPHWRDYILFYEYFHGDNGRGVGASHQTGWTALVAKLIQQSGGDHIHD